MSATTRRQAERTTRPRSKAGAASAPVLDPSKRIVTVRPKQPAPRRVAPTPGTRPRRSALPSQTEQAWVRVQAVTRFLWQHRRETNLWLSLLVAFEVVVLLALLVAYRLLSV